jgi:hypothetical protein
MQITEIYISDATMAKLHREHDVDGVKVAEVLEGAGKVPFRRLWSMEHEKWKYQLAAEVDGVWLRVILYPHSSGGATEWDLASAYPDA